MTRPCALTIAGSDSSAGAGIQADLKTFQSLGVYGLCAVTAVTAQDGRTVHASEAISPELLRAQIDSVARGFDIGAVKTGMLASGGNLEAAVAAIDAHELGPVVVDPVLVSTDGADLFDPDSVECFLTELLPQAELVTPNLAELERLSGVRPSDSSALEAAARVLLAYGVGWVLVTGGHGEGAAATDRLYSPEEAHEFSVPRLGGGGAHGSGCVLSAAITAHLALGRSVPEAVAEAKDYVTKGLGGVQTFPSGARLFRHDV